MDDLAAWIAQCKADMQNDVVARFLASVDVFIQNCPIKTGRTLNSFHASLDTPAENTDPGPGEHDKTGNLVREQARQIAEAAMPGQTIHFTSDYAPAIISEEGDRNHQPHRMIFGAAQSFGD